MLNVCNQCRLLFSFGDANANETLREQTYTDCKTPNQRFWVWDFNPYYLRSLLWAGIRIPFCQLSLLPSAFLVNQKLINLLKKKGLNATAAATLLKCAWGWVLFWKNPVMVWQKKPVVRLY
jgi:hypothetical protein